MLALVPAARAATFYVAPNGNNNNPGTLAQPFATIARGQTAAQAGDTVYFRGGEYLFQGSTIGISLNKSGAQGRPIHYFAYPGETPVFNYKGLTGRAKGMEVTGDWLHLKGLEMKEIQQDPNMQAKENWCIYVNGGSHNIFERLNLHHNMGPGYFHVDGSDNLVLNCDSHNNYDPYSHDGTKLTPGENADGFGSHPRNLTSTGNVFRGCRAWWNADDGWDFIASFTAVTVEDCWAWNNGLKAGTNTAAGNGNGFKIGGYGVTGAAQPTVLPQHTVRFCLAFNNRAAGFYQNHHPRSNFYYNNTALNNGVNFNLLGRSGTSDVSMGILRNNLSFSTANRHLSNHNLGTGVDAAYNSWNLSVTVTAADFTTTDTLGVTGPRRPDGSLPVLGLMKLVAGSDLIDKGVNVQLPFVGAAPDLGAYEYGAPVGIRAGGANRAVPAASPIWFGSELRDLLGRRARFR